MNSNPANTAAGRLTIEPAEVRPDQLTLSDPRAVLSLLEADQVVAAKRSTHFGPKKLSFGMKALLWCLRIYVVVMLAIVVISAYHALHPSP